jgi:excisionase family DNA binding protein
MVNSSPTLPRLLKVGEAAAILRCSRATAYALIRRNQLPAFRLGPNGSLRLRADALEKWVEKQETTT